MQDAESFLRLLTSLDTYYLFDRGKIELDCLFVEDYQEPAYAQRSAKDAIRLNLHRLQVAQPPFNMIG